MKEKEKDPFEIGKDLHKLIILYAKKKGYSGEELLSWMITTITGTMAYNGYTQDFFNKTCDRMKDLFTEKASQFENEKTPDKGG